MSCSGLAPAVPLSPLGASLTVSLGLRFGVMAVLAVSRYRPGPGHVVWVSALSASLSKRSVV